MGCNNTSAEMENPADTSGQGAAQQPATAPPINSIQAGCYRAVQGRDTIWLQLEINGLMVTGRMQYDNFEIDGNIGTINGTAQGNRITGLFTYFSEGMWSVREVILEARNGQLLQSDMRKINMQKDTMRFNQDDSLVFDVQRPFNSVPCSEVQFSPLPDQNPSKSF